MMNAKPHNAIRTPQEQALGWALECASGRASSRASGRGLGWALGRASSRASGFVSGRGSSRASGRRGLSLLEVIFAAAIAVVGLAMLVSIVSEQEATDDMRVVAEIMRGHGHTASNLAVADLPLFGRVNDPGNPFIATTDPQGMPANTQYTPYSLLRAVLQCMNTPTNVSAGAHAPGSGLTDFPTFNVSNQFIRFNEDHVSAGGGLQHESLLSLVAQRRAIKAVANDNNRTLTTEALEGLDEYDSIWRLLSAHCMYFPAVGPTGYPVSGNFTTDELKIAWSTNDVKRKETLGSGTFRCVDAAYIDADGEVYPPRTAGRVDTQVSLGTGPNNINGWVRFVEIDPDTCIGARLFADAAGGIHWKTSLGLNDQGNDARVAFYVGFEEAQRALDVARRLGSDALDSVYSSIAVDPAFKLKVYVVPLRYSAGAHATTLARQIGPAALIAHRGDYASSAASTRSSVPIAFREAYGKAPITENFVPWPLEDPTDYSTALLVRENAVIIDSSRFESTPANTWLASFAGEQRASEAAGIPANSINLGYNLIHTVELPTSQATTPAHTMRSDDNRYDVTSFSREFMNAGRALMQASSAGTANVPNTLSPAERLTGIDNTALPLVGTGVGEVATTVLATTPLAVAPTTFNQWQKFGTQETEGDERFWPRLLDIGSHDAPVRRLTIRDDAVFSQLRVPRNAQVQVLGKISVGVTCANLAGTSGAAQKALATGAEANQISYISGVNTPGQGVHAANTVRYEPLCRDSVTGTNVAAQAAEELGEVEIPYRGIYMTPRVDRVEIITRQIEVKLGAALPLSVLKGNGSVQEFKYKDCLLDGEGDRPNQVAPNTATSTPTGTGTGEFQIEQVAPVAPVTAMNAFTGNPPMHREIAKNPFVHLVTETYTISTTPTLSSGSRQHVKNACQ